MDSWDFHCCVMLDYSTGVGDRPRTVHSKHALASVDTNVVCSFIRVVLNPGIQIWVEQPSAYGQQRGSHSQSVGSVCLSGMSVSSTLRHVAHISTETRCEVYS